MTVKLCLQVTLLIFCIPETLDPCFLALFTLVYRMFLSSRFSKKGTKTERNSMHQHGGLGWLVNLSVSS